MQVRRTLDTTEPIGHPTRNDLVAGLLAGQVAGLIMAAVMVAVFVLFLGRPWYFPVQVIGSFATGEVGVAGPFHAPSFEAGLAIHQLGPSLFWGLAFAILVHSLRKVDAGSLIFAGLVVGVVSQLLDVSVLIPWLFVRLHGEDLWSANVPLGWSWAAHLVFGLSLASFGWIRPALGPDIRRLPRS
jgi:hypothetical protein